jgi:hypothetical protein
MKKIFKICVSHTAILPLIVLGHLSYATPAQALFGGGVNRATESTLRSVNSSVRSVRTAVDRNREAVREVQKEIFESRQALIEALRLHAGENSSYQDKQIEAQRRFKDSEAINHANLRRDLIRAEAESVQNQPNPALCLLGSLFSSGGSAASGARGSGIVANVRDRAASVPADRTLAAREVLDAQERFQGHRGSNDASTDMSLVFVEATYPQSEKDQELAAQLIQNAINVTPAPQVTPEELATPEGVGRASRQLERRVREAAIQELFAFNLNLRAPVTPKSGFEAYLEDSFYNRDVPDEISELQAIDIRTVRHYAPKQNVLDNRGTMNERALLAEILDAISIGNRIAYLQLEQDNRTSIVQGLILARLLSM